MTSPSIGHIRAVRTGIQELYDTPISVGSAFSYNSQETLLDEEALIKRMKTAFDEEFKYDTESDDEFLARPPTPIKVSTEEGRTGMKWNTQCRFCNARSIRMCIYLECNKMFAVNK
jgi:hypothetical protein